MTKKTIYAVNRGCYSDYSVTALFSEKADAKRFMELHPDEGYGGWNDIEEGCEKFGIPQPLKHEDPL